MPAGVREAAPRLCIPRCLALAMHAKLIVKYRHSKNKSIILQGAAYPTTLLTHPEASL